ncbi:MAG TPA: FHA domain-containing protein, partial [Candidatus Bathyarchaeia archaeon]|nr:FHA domain-containing protein [Candidatus Bathyarchaeia archaeon]
PGATVASKGISMEDLLGSDSSTDTSSSFEDDDNSAKSKKDKKSKKNSQDDDKDQSFEPAKLEPSSAASQWFDSGKDQSTDDFESNSSLQSNNDSDSKPSFVVSGPEPSAPSDENLSAPEPLTISQQSSGAQASGARYYIVFVNTPASSLIKTRVLMEFDDFPTVTIGRSPENVVVIPDPEVSRKHASISINGSSLTLKDLGSSNGTFVYNGKEFERVSGSATVGPNTVLKFGTGTIVKLVSE